MAVFFFFFFLGENQMGVVDTWPLKKKGMIYIYIYIYIYIINRIR